MRGSDSLRRSKFESSATRRIQNWTRISGISRPMTVHRDTMSVNLEPFNRVGLPFFQVIRAPAAPRIPPLNSLIFYGRSGCFVGLGEACCKTELLET